MFERFTTAAREAVVRARQEAQDLHHPYIGTEHVLIGLLGDGTSVAGRVLHDAGVTAPQVRAEVIRLVGTPPKLFTDEDAAALQTIGIDLDSVLARIEEWFGPGALDPPVPPARRGLLRRGPHARTGLTPRAQKVLEPSLREALRLHHHYIGPEHSLLGLIREGNGLAAKVLVEAGVDLDDLRRATVAAIPPKAGR